jgi:hypothetical protein
MSGTADFRYGPRRSLSRRLTPSASENQSQALNFEETHWSQSNQRGCDLQR